jgi:hypothetical protein
MSPGDFVLGLIVFSGGAAGIWYLVDQMRIDASKKTVAQGSVVLRNSGEVLTSGSRYLSDGYDREVSLGPRIIHASHEAGSHGVTDYLYMQVTYAPDESNLPSFAQAFREAGSFEKLDAAIVKVISGKLCMAAQADFSDLNFRNIETTYGVKILSTESKPRQTVEREKERLSGFERYVKSEISKIATLRGGIVWLAEEMKKAEEEPDPQVRQFMLDILENTAERIKTAT